VTLSSRIHDEIEARILTGEWPPGHRIPTERELTEQYECSRMTVNKALSQLAREGYIARNRRAGSVVIRPHAQSAVLEIHDVRTEVESLGLPYRFHLTQSTVRAATAAERERLEAAGQLRVRALEVVHMAGRQSFCFEERLINLAAVPAAAEVPFDAAPPGTWLLDHVPWTVAEHQISARGASEAAAAALCAEVGSPCLVIERRTRHAGRVVTFVRLTYLGESHSLLARFGPASRDSRVAETP
jgi:GntR family transcriptional regulator, histidine utilization repressor